MRRYALILGSALALAGSACTPIVDQRGHVVEQGTYEKLQAGSSTKDDVLNLLGSPSTVAAFDNETWYYISQRAERVAFREPQVREQHVVAIAFESSGTVKKIDNYSLKDGKVVDMVDRKTPTAGKELGYIEQLFGNLGKFGKPGSKEGGGPQ